MDQMIYLEYQQVILKEFDPTTTQNKNNVIQYLQDYLCVSIKTLINKHGRDQDMWNKAIMKTIDSKAKAS